MKKNKLILIATIGKPRGLKGEFFLNSFTSPAENIINYSNFLKNEDTLINLKIEYIKQINTKFYSKILDIDNVDDIKKYIRKIQETAHEGGAGAMHKAIAKRASETFSLENEAAEVTKGVTEK